MKTLESIKMGVEATDIVTGFNGTVAGKISYLTGCDQILLVPKVDKDGKYVEGRYFDINRVETTSTRPIKLEVDKENVNGGGACEVAPGY